MSSFTQRSKMSLLKPYGSNPYTDNPFIAKDEANAIDPYEILRRYRSDIFKEEPKVPDLQKKNFRSEAIGMRMRWLKCPFDFFDTHYSPALDKVFIFIVHKDQCINLADDGPLFPSDALVTQLRLLE